MLRNTHQTYGSVAQWLHWLTVLLIFILFPLGVFMHELPAANAEEATYKFWFYSLHKTIGISLFFIALVRVIWALVQPHPRPLNPERGLETFAAQTVHWILYGSIIAVPLAGWLHHSALEGFAPIWWPFFQDLPLVPKDPKLAEVFGTAHFTFAALLALAIVLHIGGALKHLVIDRDHTLRRMLPGARIPDLPELGKGGHRFMPAVLAGLAFTVAIATIGYLQTPAQTEAQIEVGTDAGLSGVNWRVDHENSQLDIEVVQSGNPVAGSFGRWTADIRFDPQDLENAEVTAEIDVASLTLGGISQQALSADFLNAAAFPTAKFVSEDFSSTGPDEFLARGELILLGQSHPLDLPFSLDIQNGRAVVKGAANIRRLDYGIGAKGFPGDNMVGLEIVVRLSLEADQLEN